MSPTETSLLGKKSDLLWQLEGVPCRTSFSKLASTPAGRCALARITGEGSETRKRPPDLQVQDVGLVRERITTSTNNLFTVHKGLGSHKALYYGAYISCCRVSWIWGFHARADTERQRGEPQQATRPVGPQLDSWPPANMGISTDCHLPGGKVHSFCLNSALNPRRGCIEFFQ